MGRGQQERREERREECASREEERTSGRGMTASSWKRSGGDSACVPDASPATSWSHRHPRLRRPAAQTCSGVQRDSNRARVKSAGEARVKVCGARGMQSSRRYGTDTCRVRADTARYDQPMAWAQAGILIVLATRIGVKLLGLGARATEDAAVLLRFGFRRQ